MLRGVEGVAFTFFDAQDVVRHPLVQRIVQAYEARVSVRREHRARTAACGSQRRCAAQPHAAGCRRRA